MIVNLVHITSSLMCGGAEKVLYVLVKELQKQHITQTVFYFHGGPYVNEIEQLGVKTQQITGWLWRYDMVFFFRLYKALRKKKPTIIHSLLWAANVTARMCAWVQDIPIISVYHNNVDQDGLIRLLCDRLTLCLGGRVVAVSQQVKASLYDRGHPGPITVIPNGIDIQERFRYVPITKQHLGLDPDTFVIGAVGRLVAVKRFDYLIRAVCVLQFFDTRGHLVIIGQGPFQHELKQLVVDLNLAKKVSFIADNALHYYALFDCFVQPSYKEGISLALLEAMSFAKTCIVMGDGYHPVITHGTDGIIVNSDSPSDLIGAIDQLYHNKEYAQKLGQSALVTVQNGFDVKRMVQEYRDMIFSLQSCK